MSIVSWVNFSSEHHIILFLLILLRAGSL